MNFEEYAQLDGIELADRIRCGEVTAAHVLRACLDGLEHVNPKLNAVVSRFTDRIERAVEQTSPRADGPLAGVPMLLKDTLLLRDTVVTYGSVICRDFVSPRTHPVAERLESAGLPLIGRTNMC